MGTTSRRRFLRALVSAGIALLPRSLRAQAGIFLSVEEAPRAVFPEGTSFERRVVTSSAQLRAAIIAELGQTRPSLWEPEYVIFTARRGDSVLGQAVIVEEIGKHRPITFVVGVRPDGGVRDVVLMVYREPYGGEVRNSRFLAQYRGKELAASLLPFRDIRNITGATLSAEAIGRGVRKALALLKALALTQGTAQ
jgi:FMN-binding protein